MHSHTSMRYHKAGHTVDDNAREEVAQVPFSLPRDEVTGDHIEDHPSCQGALCVI